MNQDQILKLIKTTRDFLDGIIEAIEEIPPQVEDKPFDSDDIPF